MVGVDALDERAHLLGLEVVDPDGDPAPARRVDERGGLLDRLGTVVLRARRGGAAAGAVDGGAGLAERDGDAAAGAAGRARDERDRAFERVHAGDGDGSNVEQRLVLPGSHPAALRHPEASEPGRRATRTAGATVALRTLRVLAGARPYAA